MAKNKLVWKYYINGVEYKRAYAIQALKANQRYLDLIRDNPDDPDVSLWLSRIKKVSIRKEYQW